MQKFDFSFLPDFSERLNENRVLRVVMNADLRCAHDGLAKLAKDLKVDVGRLKVGEFVVFINSRKTALKIYAAGNTVAHFKMPNDRKMDLKIIGMIPRFFRGGELKYDDALREMIQAQWKGRK